MHTFDEARVLALPIAGSKRAAIKARIDIATITSTNVNATIRASDRNQIRVSHRDSETSTWPRLIPPAAARVWGSMVSFLMRTSTSEAATQMEAGEADGAHRAAGPRRFPP